MWKSPLIEEKFHSPLGVDELLNRVRVSIKPLITWGFLHGEPFKGEVRDNSFRILRRSWNRNSRPPQIIGVIERATNGSGSLLSVQFEERPNVIAGKIIGSIAITIVASLIVFSGIQESHFTSPTVLIPPLVLSLVVALNFASFRFEVRKSRRLLINMLELESIATD